MVTMANASIDAVINHAGGALAVEWGAAAPRSADWRTELWSWVFIVVLSLNVRTSCCDPGR